jgi:hypothetical protein
MVFCSCGSRKDKQQLARHAPERDSIRTSAKIDLVKGSRNKKKLMRKVGYQERPKSAAGAQAAAPSSDE